MACIYMVCSVWRYGVILYKKSYSGNENFIPAVTLVETMKKVKRVILSTSSKY